MSERSGRIAALVQQFVDSIEDLVRDEIREQALAVVSEALGQTGLKATPRVRQAPPASRKVDASTRRTPSPKAPPASRKVSVPARPTPPPKVERAAVRASRGQEGRRTNVRMQRDLDAIVAYVRDHEGAKMEEIAAAVGSTSKRLHTPVQKLIAAGTLMKTGEKRGTSYWMRE